jgi:DNA-binding transcriptional LysR family regulator
MHLTFRQMQCFSAVARNLSYTRAAEELHLTQPAVSMQIRQLEQQTGLALTEQFGKRIYLTEAGEEVFRYARSILQKIDELDDVLGRLKGRSGGRLKIAAISSANYFAPRLLGTFHERFPDIEVSMEVINQTDVLRRVVENEVDMAIMGQPPKDSQVEAIPFMDNPLVIVAPPEHRLAKRKRIRLKELENEEFLIREAGSGTRGAMERFFKEHRLKLRKGMGMGSLSSIKQGVQANLGLALLQRDAMRVELQLGKLVELKVNGLPIWRKWFVVLHKGKRLSVAAEEFRSLLINESAELLKV